jgi:predicted RNA-binding Zn ribbon-like protein
MSLYPLCLEWINTRWNLTHEPYRDVLNDPGWMDDFLRRWNLPAQGPFSKEEMRKLVRLRDFLGEVVESLDRGENISGQQIATLNQYLALTPLSVELVRQDGLYQTALRAINASTDALLFYIAHSFAKFISSVEVERIKRCQNPACRWVFYDESKNASRKWCCNTCSSLIKVRNLRAKRRAQE